MKDTTIAGLTRWLRKGKPGTPLANTEVFRQFYEHHYLSVFRYVYGLHGAPIEDVEDLTAETFTRAWKGRRSFDGEPLTTGIGWLLRIAKRLVIDQYRRTQTHIQVVDEFPEEVPFTAPTPENLVQKGESYQQLWALMNKLPTRQREILVLRYFLDWRVNQIGEYLHIPENTVSVTIRRSLQQLQREWSEEKEEK